MDSNVHKSLRQIESYDTIDQLALIAVSWKRQLLHTDVKYKVDKYAIKMIYSILFNAAFGQFIHKNYVGRYDVLMFTCWILLTVHTASDEYETVYAQHFYYAQIITWKRWRWQLVELVTMSNITSQVTTKHMPILIHKQQHTQPFQTVFR